MSSVLESLPEESIAHPAADDERAAAARAHRARDLGCQKRLREPFRPFRDDNGESCAIEFPHSPPCAGRLPASRMPTAQAPQTRASSGEYQPAHLRRRERRGVFLARRKATDLSDQPGHAGHVRSDFHDERRWLEQEAVEQGRAHDVRVLLSGRQIDHLRVDPSRIGRVPAAAEFLARVRLAGLSPTYDIFRASPDGSNPRRLTTRPGTTRKPRSDPTDASSSRACATATWRSTR